MDAYLAIEAQQALNALSALAAKPGLAGFLIGHKRGHRFFVERIFPLPKGFWPSLEHYHDLNLLLDGKIIGFFAFPADAKFKNRLLRPFACGKLFLEVRPGKRGALHFKSLVIDYNERFCTAPIALQE